MSFHPCPACRRHVVHTDAVCPFCGARTSLTPRAMSYASRLTRAAIFAGAAACSRAPEPQRPPPPPTEYPFALPAAPAAERANLSGVVRGDGHRAAGVRVTLLGVDEGTTFEARTNDKGEYQFLDLPPGAYTLVADPGYQNPRPQDGPVVQLAQPIELAANANEQRDIHLVMPMPYVPDTGPCCKPYGAPPARRRLV